MDQKKIGQMIRFHRKESGLSQQQLARFAGLGKTVIFDVEHGKLTVQLETLLKIMHVLNISLEFQSPLMHLFKDEPNEKS